MQAFALAWRRVGPPDFKDSRLLPPGSTGYVPENMLARLWSQLLSDDARVLVAITEAPTLEYGRLVLEHLSDTRPPEFEFFLIDYLVPTMWRHTLHTPSGWWRCAPSGDPSRSWPVCRP